MPPFNTFVRSKPPSSQLGLRIWHHRIVQNTSRYRPAFRRGSPVYQTMHREISNSAVQRRALKTFEILENERIFMSGCHQGSLHNTLLSDSFMRLNLHACSLCVNQVNYSLFIARMNWISGGTCGVSHSVALQFAFYRHKSQLDISHHPAGPTCITVAIDSTYRPTHCRDYLHRRITLRRWSGVQHVPANNILRWNYYGTRTRLWLRLRVRACHDILYKRYFSYCKVYAWNISDRPRIRLPTHACELREVLLHTIFTILDW